MLLVEVLVGLQLTLSITVSREVHGGSGFAGVTEGVGEVGPIAMFPNSEVSA